ncbi:hypothetical protein BpHYR1_017966 [Brachionus plicatilis]|uniref:Uncharacterized protein n=1 Tax=Brachionus plicatilis TaxID=10195 RepID=A0A3M7R7E2_BRAPC|nr:hypothetical protein BpHYR1_017966 [Brachionus plicatilis]
MKRQKKMSNKRKKVTIISDEEDEEESEIEKSPLNDKRKPFLQYSLNSRSYSVDYINFNANC